MRRLAVATVAALSLACDDTLAGPGALADHYVTVGDNYFSPPVITVRVGQTVLWSWGGGASHDMVFTTPGAPANCPLATTGTCVRSFSSTGTFNYRCNPHAPGMAGQVQVVP
jgi:plastocyanin